jgi:O-antigen/teichoic acid export membrane protein
MSDREISQARTKNYIEQLKGSFIFKVLAVGCSFLALPIMVRYLGQEQFGIWSTLLSLVTWIVFFDLGVGNGLRNKVAESLAKNQVNKAASYISSGYSLIGLISITLFLAMLMAGFIIPWQLVFNTETVSEETLRQVVLLTGFAVIANFWIGLINQVINAAQKTSVVVFGQFLSNALALIGVYGLSVFTSASMLYMAIVYGASLIITNVLLTFWFYSKQMILFPKLSLDSAHVRPLLTLGGQFFIIQFAVLVIFTTDKILITQLFGPQYVTQYAVVFMLFGVFTMIYGMIAAPLWSAYTDAYHSGDVVWIRAALFRQLWVFGAICLAVLVMALLARQVISLWMGQKLDISLLLVISMASFVIVSVWSNVFAILVNGLGKLKVQLAASILAMFANIPLTIFLVKYLEFGIDGVVWATTISLLPFALIGPVQVFFLLQVGSSEES